MLNLGFFGPRCNRDCTLAVRTQYNFCRKKYISSDLSFPAQPDPGLARGVQKAYSLLRAEKSAQVNIISVCIHMPEVYKKRKEKSK